MRRREFMMLIGGTDLGARDEMLLDGGDSSSMAISTEASMVSLGPVYGR